MFMPSVGPMFGMSWNNSYEQLLNVPERLAFEMIFLPIKLHITAASAFPT